MRRETRGKLLSVLLALLLWQAASMLANLPVLLPPPLRVIGRLFAIAGEGQAWLAVGRSLGRIAAGFLLGAVSGCAAAVLAARYPLAETLLWPYVTAMKSVPVVSFIIICVIWFSAGQLVVLIAFLMVFPILYSNLLAGIRAADPKLLEMARCFDVPKLRRVRCIWLPQLQPWLHSACTSALGLAWKAGVAAEVIGVVSASVGERLYLSKIYFEVADLLAWTVIIILCSGACEKLVSALLNWCCGRWSRL